jgi:hypothetical protein
MYVLLIGFTTEEANSTAMVTGHSVVTHKTKESCTVGLATTFKHKAVYTPNTGHVSCLKFVVSARYGPR